MQIEVAELLTLSDEARHCAFTDLVKTPRGLFCAYRAASTHMSGDGVVRVQHSPDGRTWAVVATLSFPNADLRDPKFCVLPGGRLLLTTATRVVVGKRADIQTYRFLGDGLSWGEPLAIGAPDFWLWRVTWLGSVGLSFAYNTRTLDRLRVYTTLDGTTFHAGGADAEDRSYPNEHAIARLPDGSCVCLLRRDFGPRTALVGRSREPWTEWTWGETDTRIGGPSLIATKGGELLACIRRMRDGIWRTVLCTLDPAVPELTPLCDLPSGGDTSYAGMVEEGDDLWVSYYSGHVAGEDEARVYIARCRMKRR